MTIEKIILDDYQVNMSKEEMQSMLLAIDDYLIIMKDNLTGGFIPPNSRYLLERIAEQFQEVLKEES